MIEQISYDDDRCELWIAFLDTGRYLYADVPPEVFEVFCKAKSAGEFFNAEIKGRYRFQRDPARRRFCPED